MNIYTQMLDDEAATLSPDDEDYEEKLLDVARSFRTFSEALTQFVCDNGFEGAADDKNGKLAFLKSKFKLQERMYGLPFGIKGCHSRGSKNDMTLFESFDKVFEECGFSRACFAGQKDVFVCLFDVFSCQL